MSASQAIELPSDPSSGEEGFRQVAGQPHNIPDTAQEECCKYHCQTTLTEDNPLVVARLVELKTAIESTGAVDKKKDLQFQMIRAWNFASKQH